MRSIGSLGKIDRLVSILPHFRVCAEAQPQATALRRWSTRRRNLGMREMFSQGVARCVLVIEFRALPMAALVSSSNGYAGEPSATATRALRWPRYIELNIIHLIKYTQRPDGSAQRHLFNV
jgi:hypothetical protein